ncbi:MAG: hypothetical protein BGN89_11960 [Alphaproteobacteria bacterium 64-6]|nr:hypothetical protein [Hyphomicrobium sp.]OJU28487.1 MAG: hypothetical protein BGN89_11960 [Alphaproteobacteria bacterium 64-6]
MTAEHDIDYDALAQEAMRGVVRAVLSRVQKTGLPGNHHFYIAFDTRHPGVVLSKRLKSKYAEEMTIVLQHRFWELIVTDVRFEVKLTFDGIPERLVIPFDAIKVFFDPSVPYGLQFDEAGATREGTGSVVGLNEESGIAGQITGVPGLGRASGRPSPGDRKRPPRRTRSDKEDEAVPVGDEQMTEGAQGRRAEPAARPQAALVPITTGVEGDADAPDDGTPTQDNVISLDRFRKKP